MKMKENLFFKYILSTIAVISAIVLAVTFACFVPSLTAHAEESTGKYTYNFSITTHSNSRYLVALSSDGPCVATAVYPQSQYNDFNFGCIPQSIGYEIKFYTLNSSGKVEAIKPYIISYQEYENGKWVESESYEYGENMFTKNISTINYYVDLKGSNLKCLHYTTTEFEYDEYNDNYKTVTVGADNIRSYLTYGTFSELPKGTKAYALTELASLTPAKYQYSASSNYKWVTYDDGIKLTNVSIDESGKITWNEPVVLPSCIYKGVVVSWGTSGNGRPTQAYYKTFPISNSIKVSIPSGMDITNIQLYPYAITTDGRFIGASATSTISLDADASYMNVENPTALFTASDHNVSSGGIEIGSDDDFNDDIVHGGGGVDSDGNKYVVGSTLIASGLKRPLTEVVDLPDFKLLNVSVSTGVGGFTKTITWDGTSIDDRLELIPSSDSITIATYVLCDQDLNYYPYELDTVETSTGRIKIDYSKFISDVVNGSYKWDGEISLCPVYYSDGIMYMGRETTIDLLYGGIDEWYVDESGDFQKETVREDTSETPIGGTGDGIFSDMSGILNNVGSMSDFTNYFWGFLQNLVSLMGSFPSMVSTIFGFLPSIYIKAIGVFLLIILILRVLGR